MRTFIYTLLFFSIIACKQQRAKEERKIKLVYCKSKASDKDWYSSNQKAPIFKGLERIDFRISSKSREAQQYFNQGMMLSYGFNHAEAARSFYQAIRIDSNCAMCYWGYAYVLGPNYNAGMEEDNFQRAYAATKKALKLSAQCSEKERALIEALQTRYVKNPHEDRKPLDIAYSRAMKAVYAKFPNDPDIGALYAESLLDLHPWDLYEKKTKKPKIWTPEITNILEHLMKQNPLHPGAHHFYIHAVEASSTPERGLQSAELLSKLVPGSGHLLHMPSHIYINTGDYHLGSLANVAAIKVDSEYVSACNAQGVYPLAYYPHNYHFLAATALLEGNSKLTWHAARKVRENAAPEIMKEPGWGTLQHYYSIPYYVAVKLGMWDTILSSPEPEEVLVYPRAVYRYARGMAHAEKNQLQQAEKELSLLIILAKDSALKEITIWDINSSEQLIHIAKLVLSAEISRQKKEWQQSISLLKEAVAIEDDLSYDEPPDWFFSVRHMLGKVFLEAERYTEAEKVFRDDLKTYRENGWALSGLYLALKKQHKDAEAIQVKQRLDVAWRYADEKLKHVFEK